jgi:hypothetical protein
MGFLLDLWCYSDFTLAGMIPCTGIQNKFLVHLVHYILPKSVPLLRNHDLFGVGRTQSMQLIVWYIMLLWKTNWQDLIVQVQ